MKKQLKSLKQVVDVLNKYNIHFWMYGGVLASYVKIHDLFPWDEDVDLFIWKEDFEKLIDIKDKFGLDYIFKEYTLALKGDGDDLDIDIMYFEKDDGTAFFERLRTKNKIGRILYFGILSRSIKYRLLTVTKIVRFIAVSLGGCGIVRQEVPIHFFKELKEIDLFGIKLKVPRDHEAFMDYTYGPYWRLPLDQQEKRYIREGKCHPDYFQVIKK